jgi:hypothetical protein
MTEWTRISRRYMALSAGLAALVLGGGSSTAAASIYFPEPPVQYETEPQTPPFCTPTVVGDYLEPLARLPKLNAPPASGRVGFGPASLRLSPLPALVAGEGRIGYQLFLEGQAPALHPNWVVTTTLARLSWKGRVVKVIKQMRRRVKTLRAGRGAGVGFELKGVTAPYRVTTVFRSKSGKKLGSYGFYFRLVPPIGSVGLRLNAPSVKAGGTIFGRVENFGTLWASYGAQYVIEQLEGGVWKKAPESPEAFTLPIFSAEPGKSGIGCSAFKTRWWMPTGRYRMTKEVLIEAAPRSRPTPVTVSAEFDLVR